MKVFLVGATGAIGRRLVPRLIEAGHEVTAMTRSKEKLGELYDLGAEPVMCDVFDAGRLGSEVARAERSEEHTSELQSRQYLVCRLLLEKNKCRDDFA